MNSITTEFCIICGGQAHIFGGHVHFNKDDPATFDEWQRFPIIAGFCETHQEESTLSNGCEGCHGVWEPKMGLTIEHREDEKTTKFYLKEE